MYVSKICIMYILHSVQSMIAVFIHFAAFVWYRIIFIILTAAAKNIILYYTQRVYYIILFPDARKPVPLRYIYNIIIVNCYFLPPVPAASDLSLFLSAIPSPHCPYYNMSVSLVSPPSPPRRAEAYTYTLYDTTALPSGPATFTYTIKYYLIPHYVYRGCVRHTKHRTD